MTERGNYLYVQFQSFVYDEEWSFSFHTFLFGLRNSFPSSIWTILGSNCLTLKPYSFITQNINQISLKTDVTICRERTCSLLCCWVTSAFLFTSLSMRQQVAFKRKMSKSWKAQLKEFKRKIKPSKSKTDF